MWKVTGQQLTQKFNQRVIFENVSFEITSGHSIVLMGPNGSGKTSLIRVICQLVRPRAGKVGFFQDGEQVPADRIYPHIGLVGPYLQLYNNLTALENYTFFARIRGLAVDVPSFRLLMSRVGLQGRELDQLATYSSGMLQRVKYVMALIHRPEILILDEPTSNLDESGSEIVYQIMEEQKQNKILIVATNEPEEFKFGEKQIQLAS